MKSRLVRGFTLVEMIVVVAIVGVLASAAIPLVALGEQRLKERELRHSLREIRTAIDAYHLAVDQGRIVRKALDAGYPPTLAVLAEGVPDARSPSAEKKLYFLRRVPRDPFAPPGTLADQSWGLRSYASPPNPLPLATMCMTSIPAAPAPAAMALPTDSGKPRARGFTLVELLVVMAIIATLLALAVPRYSKAEDKARVAALKSNLRTLREAIDHFHGDRGEYPQTLQELVQHRYLRTIPADPVLGHAQAWALVPVPADATPPAGNGLTGLGNSANNILTTSPGAPVQAPPRPGGIYDVRSSAEGAAPDGTSYAAY